MWTPKDLKEIEEEISNLHEQIIEHTKSLPNTEDMQFVYNLSDMGTALSVLEATRERMLEQSSSANLELIEHNKNLTQPNQSEYDRFYGLGNLKDAFVNANDLHVEEDDEGKLILEYPSREKWFHILMTLKVNSGNGSKLNWIPGE
tara:strand:- start:3021 stop:3458 length:438 start_codon:yes stop_codon:yes gene_type:complete